MLDETRLGAFSLEREKSSNPNKKLLSWNPTFQTDPIPFSRPTERARFVVETRRPSSARRSWNNPPAARHLKSEQENRPTHPPPSFILRLSSFQTNSCQNRHRASLVPLPRNCWCFLYRRHFQSILNRSLQPVVCKTDSKSFWTFLSRKFSEISSTEPIFWLLPWWRQNKYLCNRWWISKQYGSDERLKIFLACSQLNNRGSVLFVCSPSYSHLSTTRDLSVETWQYVGNHLPLLRHLA